jgi:hypothetical protein
MSLTEKDIINWMDEIGLTDAIKKIKEFEDKHKDIIDIIVKQTRKETFEQMEKSFICDWDNDGTRLVSQRLWDELKASLS